MRGNPIEINRSMVRYGKSVCSERVNCMLIKGSDEMIQRIKDV